MEKAFKRKKVAERQRWKTPFAAISYGLEDTPLLNNISG
jgi:hypothetical protein